MNRGLDSPTSPPSRRWAVSLPSGPLLGLLVVLGFFVVLVSTRGDLDRFLTLRNLQDLLHNSSVTGVAALGLLLIIISGGIDLSVGSVVALVTVVTMQVFRFLEAREVSIELTSLSAALAGIATGACCGGLTGQSITRLRLSPFVVTLGMMSIARGLAYWLSGKTQLPFRAERPEWVYQLGRSRAGWLLFDPGVWSFFLLAVLIALLLRYTVLGRYCYAIGSNESTARLCGVHVERTKVWIYTLAGMLIGWAGILRFAHSSSGDPNTGQGLELEVIAAVVIGGASLSGGQGTVLGTVLGVLILGVLENGVNFFQVPLEIKYILIGAIVISNTALSRLQQRNRS